MLVLSSSLCSVCVPLQSECFGRSNTSNLGGADGATIILSTKMSSSEVGSSGCHASSLSIHERPVSVLIVEHLRLGGLGNKRFLQVHRSERGIWRCRQEELRANVLVLKFLSSLTSVMRVSSSSS